MIRAALRGALGFLTRLPVTHRDGDFAAFAAAPWTFPAVGYLVGGLAALPLFAPSPALAAAGYVIAVYLLTGVNHADGLADLGDAAAVHSGPDAAAVRGNRVDAMRDTDLGVGGALAVVVTVVALALAALALGDAAAARVTAFAVVAVAVAAEVGAKVGLAALACLGTARHEGLGSALTDGNGRRDLWVVAAIALPGAVLGGVATVAAALVALATALAVKAWADARLGGVSGDVFGAANELARVGGLLAGAAALTV